MPSFPKDEESDRNERIEKQLYLKEQIVNKGYSKEKFAFFVNKVKDSEGNIDVWSFDELKFIVSQFQSENQPEVSSHIGENVDDDQNYEFNFDEYNNENQVHDWSQINSNLESAIEVIEEVEILCTVFNILLILSKRIRLKLKVHYLRKKSLFVKIVFVLKHDLIINFNIF